MGTDLNIEQYNRPLYRTVVRDGLAGNYDIVYEMIRLIRNDVDFDLTIEALAKNILINSSLNSYSPLHEQFNALFRFVKQSVTYIQDIAGRIESLKGARVTLSDGFGDCDDQTVLNATLLGCIGIEDVRIAMAKYEQTDVNFAHVYCVAYVDGSRWVFDTTLPNAKLNDEMPAVEVQEVGVFSEVKGYDGASGLYNRIRLTARHLTREGIKTIPNALGNLPLPLGFVAGKAIETGATLINQSTGDTFSLPATASNINRELDDIILSLTNGEIAVDHAKAQALQIAATLAALDIKPHDKYTLKVVGNSIKEKLQFINDFKQYAEDHNIKTVHLNPTVMLGAGLVALASVPAFFIYKYYYGKQIF